MKTDALSGFISKLDKFSNMKNFGSKIANKVGERGVEIAYSEYNSLQRADVRTEKTTEPNKVKVVAKGVGLAFEEFGTGLVGQGTYKGNLPTETIAFESPKGDPQRTEGWVYYYPNKKTKVLGGWFAGKVFHRGQVAKAQMFNTSQRLKTEMSSIAKETIKEAIKQ